MKDFKDNKYDFENDDFENDDFLSDIDNDSFYEDRLNEVYDEISQLKSELSTNSAQPKDSDIYNEMSRLREELRRNQNSQKMQAEMSRMKEEMTRDTALIEEMKRIKDRLDAIQGIDKNKPKDKEETAGQNNLREELSKVIAQNEAILKALSEHGVTPETSAKVESELDDLSNLINNFKTEAQNAKDNEGLLLKSELTSMANDVLYEIKNMKDLIKSEVEVNYTASEDIYAILISEISSLREDVLSNKSFSKGISDLYIMKIDMVFDEILKLKASVDAGNETKSEKEMSDFTAELMALKEEVKAGNIMEQNEFLREIESIKEYLDNAKTYRTVITESGDQIEPTYSEVNLILSEIISLREEIQSYKDDLSKGGAIYNDESDIKTSLEQLKDMVSRRASLVQTESGAVSSSDAMEVVLDEIINLKGAISEVKREIENVKSDKTELNEIKSMLQMLLEKEGVVKEETYETEDTVQARGFSILFDEITALREDVSGGDVHITPSATPRTAVMSKDDKADIISQIASIKSEVSNALKNIPVSPAPAAAPVFLAPAATQTVSAVYDDALREDLSAMRKEIHTLADEPNLTVLHEVLELRDEFQAFKEAVNEKGHIDKVITLEPDRAILEEVRALREQTAATQIPVYSDTNTDAILEEIKALKEYSATQPAAVYSDMNTDAVLEEIKSLKSQILAANTEYNADELLNEIKSLKEQISQTPVANVDEVLKEVKSLKEQNAVQPTAVYSDMNTDAVLEEIRALKSQIIAPNTEYNADELLNEIKALKSQIVQTPVANVDEVLKEVKTLRDQLFTISMANVSEDGESTYENYNNIILQEVSAIRDVLDILKQAEPASVIEEIQTLRDQLFTISMANVNEGEESTYENYNNIILEEVSAIRDVLDTLKESEPASVIEEIQTLRDQLFAISMANVSEGGESDYENYNNIILEELSAIRDVLDSLKLSEINSVIEEIESIKETILTSDLTEDVKLMLTNLEASIEELKEKSPSEDVFAQVISGLEQLKKEVFDRRTADELTINFMNEMALILERQNEYIMSPNKPKTKMEGLRGEIGTTISVQDAASKKELEDLSKTLEDLKLEIAGMTEKIKPEPEKE